jgi:HTH-type transcriptional regulator/antitoxin MqsA
MQCLVCGAAEAIHVIRDIPCLYKGEEFSITGVEGDFCPTCGETILDMANATRYSSLLGEFHKRINNSAKIATPPAESKL